MLSPWKFSCFYFTPRNSRQNKGQPLDIPQNCVRSLGNSKQGQKQRRLDIRHYFSLVTLGNSTSFSISPWKFHMLLLLDPWKFHILNPPCLDLSWNSPFLLGLPLLALSTTSTSASITWLVPSRLQNSFLAI